MSGESGLLHAAALEVLPAIAHAFETRAARLTDELPAPVLRLRQVHGDVVHVIEPGTDLDPYLREAIAERPAGDAIVSLRPGVTVAVATADCVPVLIASEGGVVAAAHAGWRGIAGGVIPRTLAAIAEFDASASGRVRAAIGPCASAPSYEVSAEVRDAFLGAGLPGALFEPTRPGHWTCDLVGAAEWQLRRGGVNVVEPLRRCTVGEPEAFHSWRRDGAAAGRMLSGIALRD